MQTVRLPLAAVPVALLAVLSLGAAAGGLTHPQPAGHRGDLTPAQYRAAVHAAQDRLDRTEGVRLTQAFAVLRPRRNGNPSNVGVECPGEVLRVTVVGRFPGVTTGGSPGTPHRVTALLIDATPDGQPCVVGVGVAARDAPPHGAADLLPDLR